MIHQLLKLMKDFFFSKLENYLQGFFKITDFNSLKKAIDNKKEIEWEELFEHPSLPYCKIYQYVLNRGKGWTLPSIDDFINLSNSEKKQFTNDMYWSCTPYDNENLWAFSFKTNRKIITNKNLYCHVILKQDK